MKVTIGGIDASVIFAGSAPDLVSGALQVNAIVPSDVVPGPGVPIVLAVGSAVSRNGVTISVQ